MTIENIKALRGPNIYTNNPVLIMRLRLDELTERESTDIPGFTERLIAALPGLHQHHCAAGRPGGFIERLNEGTYFGHIVEHVALELSEPAGIPAFFGKTRYAGEPGCYNVVVEYKAEEGMIFLLKAAVEMVEALVRGEEFPLQERLQEARRIVAHTELGPSTRAIIDAAERRGIPWTRIDDASLIQLGHGRNRRHIAATIAGITGAIGVDISCDKALTKKILADAWLPVPAGRTVRSADEAVAAMQEMEGPVVIKPLDGNQGRGVSLNLTTPEQVRTAFAIASEICSDVLVEEQYNGRNYRVVVVDGKMVAAAERMPPSVVGDGTNTIRDLVDIENCNPLRGEDHEKPLTRIIIDEVVEEYLRKAGYALHYVPYNGERVYLRESVNLSTGGTAADVTDQVHPEIVRMCERASNAIGLNICGVDLVMEDISRPMTKGGGIVELNAAPGIRMHHFPSAGASRDVGGAIVEMLYPNGAPARIPIIAITGTNGKTTTTRMLSHVIAATGVTVGTTTTDGICINGDCITRGDMTGPRSARSVLADPSVDVAVLETARGGIVRNGLGYDWADVAIITNIQPDHIGQDGIEHLDDLVHIKALVAERVRPGGTLVLNADDDRVARLPERRRVRKGEKRIVYFSLSPENPVIREHLSRGGTAFYLRDGWIIECTAGVEFRVVNASAIPVTMGGTADFHIANAMAVIAACRAYGMGGQEIVPALATFDNNLHNPGRSNIYRVNGGYLMVDYGHNPDSFEAVSRMISRWRGRRVTGVIGVPGDRKDSIIEHAGRIASRGFHRIIIREDDDTRGRSRGEVAGLLYWAIKSAMPTMECAIALDEREALRLALREMIEEDAIVFFYDDFEGIRNILAEAGAVPVSTIPELESMQPA